MSTFVVNGGRKLHGSIAVSSGKNSPIALLCASLVVAGEVTLRDVSRVDEVFRMLEILQSIGVKFAWQNDHTLWLDTRGPLTLQSIDREACRKVRASLELFGALAARAKRYRLYHSGGCKLGERTVRPHVFALQKLGIHITTHDEHYEVENGKRQGARVVMYESGDTATVNVIQAAVLAPGKTTIVFASANYMVQEVCYFLQAAGAKIEGIGTTTLTVIGVKKLRDQVDYSLLPDPVDAMAWIALGITTHSMLTVVNCPIDFLELELEKLSVMGQKFRVQKRRPANNKKFTVADIHFTPSALNALPDKIYGRPYPGLNIDSLPLFVPILTQAKGRTLVHDWVYENRALYYLELQKLGARVLLLDPHRLQVEGPTALSGNQVICPPAIRPAMAILIAMCAAKGTSVLREVSPIERGYEDLIPRLRQVGVDIRRQNDEVSL